MNATGTALIYTTYIGGQADDRAAGIAADSAGQAYVTGSTSSSNFPLSAPIRSRLGGSNYDLGNAIAVDGSGNAYIQATLIRLISRCFTGDKAHSEVRLMRSSPSCMRTSLFRRIGKRRPNARRAIDVSSGPRGRFRGFIYGMETGPRVFPCGPKIILAPTGTSCKASGG